MTYAQRDASSDHAKRLRKRGGMHMKKLRENAGLTQRELALAVDINYYTFISQLENGSGRVPPNLYEKFAKALGVKPAVMAKKLLMYYDPFVYKALFGVPTKKDLQP